MLFKGTEKYRKAVIWKKSITSPLSYYNLSLIENRQEQSRGNQTPLMFILMKKNADSKVKIFSLRTQDVKLTYIRRPGRLYSITLLCYRKTKRKLTYNFINVFAINNIQFTHGMWWKYIQICYMIYAIIIYFTF